MTTLAATTWRYERNGQCGTSVHHPHRVECPEPPGECCSSRGPLLCCVDAEDWPCTTKREHTAARAVPAPRWRVFKGRRGWALTDPSAPWTVLRPVWDANTGWEYATDSKWPTWQQAFARASS